MLIINADDLGRSKVITDNIISCFMQKRIHTVSAMVFMEDSERASKLTAENNIPVGLHINFIQHLALLQAVFKSASLRHVEMDL